VRRGHGRAAAVPGVVLPPCLAASAAAGRPPSSTHPCSPLPPTPAPRAAASRTVHTCRLPACLPAAALWLLATILQAPSGASGSRWTPRYPACTVGLTMPRCTSPCAPSSPDNSAAAGQRESPRGGQGRANLSRPSHRAARCTQAEVHQAGPERAGAAGGGGRRAPRWWMRRGIGQHRRHYTVQTK